MPIVVVKKIQYIILIPAANLIMSIIESVFVAAR
jgi:hypothetical protein